MSAVPIVALPWLVELVNGYGHRPREVAGEADNPYPALVQAMPSTAAAMSSRELVALADLLWPVFDQHAPAQRATALNELLAAAALVPHVSPAGALAWSSAHRGRSALTTAGCAVALLAEVTARDWGQLGVCDGADCDDVHIHQRGRRRRYCSTTCLNRARVRAYRARN